MRRCSSSSSTTQCTRRACWKFLNSVTSCDRVSLHDCCPQLCQSWCLVAVCCQHLQWCEVSDDVAVHFMLHTGCSNCNPIAVQAMATCSSMRPSVDISVGGEGSDVGVGAGGARTEYRSTVATAAV